MNNSVGRPRLRGRLALRLTAILGSALMLVTGIVVLESTQSASASIASQFDPGLIINDSQFYDGAAMTEAEIQAFLVAKNGSCTNSNCLRMYTETVPNRARLVSSTTGDVRCEAFPGGNNLSAAAIIYRAQVACGISAKVILVTLEKEQGLVGDRGPSLSDLNWALGQGCPDTSACNPAYKGFGAQVYYGTLQLKTYKASEFGKQPDVHEIQYHPDKSCGSLRVNVRNYATMALYNYTPYTPTQAALDAYPGAVSKCGSYGNRNFWFFYNNWFGSPVDVFPNGVEVSRNGGADRYEVAVDVSKKNFGPGVPVVYISTGLVFSDAISSGPAAAVGNGPVLLTRGSIIPVAVREEIQRLAPQSIVVVGGPPSVPEVVYNELAKLTPTISRISGADRYAVSRSLAESVFGVTGTDTAYLATGATFADALSASAAAGARKAPVILVRGTDAVLDDATRATLLKLGVKNVFIAGGPPSVSLGIEASLRALSSDTQVKRYGGRDRYEVSNAINKDSFSATDTVYVASGLVYPDALSGSPVAAINGSPLYVVRPSCMMTEVAQQIVDLGAKRMVILGGPPSVNRSVEGFDNC